MAGEFEGKVIVITGAAGNVGSVVTRHSAEAGAKLALWDRHKQDEASLKEMFGDAEVLPLEVDLTNPESVDAVLAETINHYGQIDVLLHIAGGFAAPGPVHEGHLDVWHKMMTLNATALYITCGKVAASMLEKGVKGSIVTVAARGGLKGGKNSAVYAASKAAAIRIVESMSEELKHEGIRVNTILPSIIDTESNRQAMGEANADKWVTPDEIAETMLFLASDRASAITGASVEVYKRV